MVGLGLQKLSKLKLDFVPVIGILRLGTGMMFYHNGPGRRRGGKKQRPGAAAVVF